MRRSLTITPDGKLIDDSWKDRLFQKAVSFKGRSAIANLFRRNFDYQSMARRCLVVDQMSLGALPYYERDPIGDDSEEE